MPRFYFHLHDDFASLDEEGQEFDDLDAALRSALLAAHLMAADQNAREGCLVLSHRLDIADEQQRVVRSIRFGDAVELRTSRPYFFDGGNRTGTGFGDLASRRSVSAIASRESATCLSADRICPLNHASSAQ